MKKLPYYYMIHFVILKSVLRLRILALAEKPITILGFQNRQIRSEDGLSVIP